MANDAREIGTTLYDAMMRQTQMLDDVQLEKLLGLVALEAGRRELPRASLLHEVGREWEAKRSART
jgi:hypothetical protein